MISRGDTMKRDHSFLSKYFLYILISFLITLTLFFILVVLLTLAHGKFRFDEHVLRIVLISFLSVCVSVGSFLLRRLSKLRGYICGLIIGGGFMLIKFTMSLASGGVGKGNFAVYFCIISASLIGGIIAANNTKKIKW